VLTFSEEDVINEVFNMLDAEHAVSTDTLVKALADMQLPHPPGERLCIHWTAMQIRIVVAGLLRSRQLDMHPNGTLYIPASSPDPAIERFGGGWYATVPDGIKGPFDTEGEARDVANLCSKVRTERR